MTVSTGAVEATCAAIGAAGIIGAALGRLAYRAGRTEEAIETMKELLRCHDTDIRDLMRGRR
jgi:Flp pilus assembly protein TadD